VESTQGNLGTIAEFLRQRMDHQGISSSSRSSRPRGVMIAQLSSKEPAQGEYLAGVPFEGRMIV